MKNSLEGDAEEKVGDLKTDLLTMSFQNFSNSRNDFFKIVLIIASSFYLARENHSDWIQNADYKEKLSMIIFFTFANFTPDDKFLPCQV